MDDVILNSLLRLSKQVTPKRETYPVPYNGWSNHLRKSEPPVNLSTYYLLDSPSCSSSPKRSVYRISSSVSTSAISPIKAIGKLSPQKKSSVDPSTEPSRRITEPENESKKVTNKEKGRFNRHYKSFDSSYLNAIKVGKTQKKDSKVIKPKKNQDYIVKNLKQELNALQKELAISKEKVRMLQESKTNINS